MKNWLIYEKKTMSLNASNFSLDEGDGIRLSFLEKPLRDCANEVDNLSNWTWTLENHNKLANGELKNFWCKAAGKTQIDYFWGSWIVFINI